MTEELETAIPISHAQLSGIFEEVKKNPEYNPDKTIADLASHEGWLELEKLIKTEIDRLTAPEWAGETVEEYGFKCLASSLAKSKLLWITEMVNATAKSVREREKSE